MQNEFEKQVSKKMEELDFVPSQPVWQKIEEQIRAKKERRRMVLWLPLMAALLGGAILWFVFNQQSDIKTTSETKSEKFSAGNNESTVSKHNESTPANEIQDQLTTSEHVKSALTEDQTNQSVQNTGIRQTETSAVVSQEKIPDENLSAAYRQEKLSAHVSKPAVSKKPGGSVDSEIPASQSRVRVPFVEVEGKNHFSQFEMIRQSAIPSTAEPLLMRNKNQEDTVAAAPVNAIVKNFGRSNWKMGIVAAAGLSGAGEGLNLYSAEKLAADANMPNSSSLPPPMLYNRNVRPSPAGNDLAFSLGFVLRKQLNKRFAFSTGLQYNYMSTRMKVGYRLQQSAIGNSTGNLNFYSSASYRDYHNRFHFISIPVSLEFQVFKRLPLHVQAGASMRQLVSTNALQFDGSSQMYYSNSKNMNARQLFTEFALGYTVPFKKMSVALGPQLQYGLTPIEKGSSNKHLFALGLKAQVLL
jgi:hypothetical protein